MRCNSLGEGGVGILFKAKSGDEGDGN